MIKVSYRKVNRKGEETELESFVVKATPASILLDEAIYSVADLMIEKFCKNPSIQTVTHIPDSDNWKITFGPHNEYIILIPVAQ